MRDLLAEDEARSGRVALALQQRAREQRDVISNLKSPAGWLLDALGATSKSGATVSENTAFNVSVFSACTNILGQSLGMLPLKVYRKTATGAEEAADHPAAPLLKRKPGPGQTSYQWRAYKMTCVSVGGNAYSRIVRDEFFQPRALLPMVPAETRPELLGDGRLIYRYRNDVLQDFDVIHLRGLSSNGYTGRSPLHDMRDSLGLAMTAQEYTSRTFLNGNRKAGIFEGPASMDRPKAEEFKKFWEANYAGMANAGRNPMLFGGITWKDAGFSNQDAELLMSRRFEVEEISRAFRVPLHLLNSTEKSTTWGSGIEQLNRGFVDYTLLPWTTNWEQELEDKLLTEEEKAQGYFIRFNLGVLLRGSPETRAKFYEIMRRIRAMDVNQIRGLEDWNEYADTGANNPEWPLNAQQADQGAPEPKKVSAELET